MASTRRKAAATRVFDARPDRRDLRDFPYRPPLRSLPPRFPHDETLARQWPAYVGARLVLDQGREGACTGFGLACVVNFLLWARHAEAGDAARFASVSPRMLYEMAKRYDEWPGRDYDGSSCRGALKGWHKHGVCAEALWPYVLDKAGKPVFERPGGGWDTDAATRPLGVYYRIDRESVTDLQAAIAEIGAVYVSCGVHDGWDALAAKSATKAPSRHDDIPVIPAPSDRSKAGGHAFALVGYSDRGFVVQNSWGDSWGAGGFAVLPYEDWLERSTDAWACALGVPRRTPATAARGTRAKAVAASRHRVASGHSLLTAEDPPAGLEVAYAGYQPWTVAEAYEHALVSGNDGELVVADATRDREDRAGYAKEIAYDRPMRALANVARPRVVVYAHGGLVGEDEAIRHSRLLGPCFEANGIYPVFLAWKTGPVETIADLAEDWGREVFGGERPTGFADWVDNASDRAVEVLARGLGRGIWREMRENAERGARAGHNLDALATNLGALSAACAGDGRPLELHLAGHSAGSILLGHLLSRLAIRVRTVSLLAPACSVRFALDHYRAAQADGRLDLSRVYLHVLSDANEKRDGLPSPAMAAYGKSLLYLVSRALEDARKMPILGLARAHDPAYVNDAEQWAAEELPSLRAWRDAWPAANLTVVSAPDVRVSRDGRREQSTHGALDDDLDTMTQLIRRMSGRALVAPLETLGSDPQ